MVKIDRSLAAVVLVVAASVISSSCLHDWDAYEAPEDGTGEGGSSSGSNVSLVCLSACSAYADCIANDWSNCPADCTAKVANCSSQALDSLEGCAAEVRASCEPSWAARTAWDVCVSINVTCLLD